MNAEKTLSVLALEIEKELEYAYEIHPRLGCGADPMYNLKANYEIAHLAQRDFDLALQGLVLNKEELVKTIAQDLCQYYTMRRREGTKESFLQILERVLTLAMEEVR